MMNIDQNKMQQVIQEAFDKATGSRRWQTAIVVTGSLAWIVVGSSLPTKQAFIWR